MVDAAEHQIRRGIEQLSQGQLDAIRWRAVQAQARMPSANRPSACSARMALEGQTMAGSGALLIGAHHRDTSSGGCFMGQRFDAFGKDPIVVTDQDLEGEAIKAMPHAR